MVEAAPQFRLGRRGRVHAQSAVGDLQLRSAVGIDDDVTHLSLPVDEDFRIAPEGLTAVFFGLGALLIKTVSRVEV